MPISPQNSIDLYQTPRFSVAFDFVQHCLRMPVSVVLPFCLTSETDNIDLYNLILFAGDIGKRQPTWSRLPLPER